MAGADGSHMAPDKLCRLRETIENIQHFQFDRELPPAWLWGLRMPIRCWAAGSASARSARNGARAPDAISARPAASRWRWPCLAAKGGGETLWIQTDFARLEGGALYGIGLDLFGLPSRRLAGAAGAARHRRAVCDGGGAQMPRASQASSPNCRTTAPTSPRRAGSRSPRATHDGLGLLLRHRSSSMPSAAMTRWNGRSRVGPARRFRRHRHTSFPALSGEEPARTLRPVECCVGSS